MLVKKIGQALIVAIDKAEKSPISPKDAV